MKRILIALALIAISGTVYAADVFRPTANTTITTNPYTSTAATTLPGSYITVLRLVPTVDVYFNIGVSPNASASSTGTFLPAYQTEYFNIGAGEQIAVISVSATGTLYISDMSK